MLSPEGEENEMTETDKERAERHERERKESNERHEREREESHERHEREREEDRARAAEQDKGEDADPEPDRRN